MPTPTHEPELSDQDEIATTTKPKPPPVCPLGDGQCDTTDTDANTGGG